MRPLTDGGWCGRVLPVGINAGRTAPNGSNNTLTLKPRASLSGFSLLRPLDQAMRVVRGKPKRLHSLYAKEPLMNILVACESSGTVRNAFRKLGHNAWSCDLLPSDDDSPYHYQEDCLQTIRLRGPWDLVIAHPPCTHLAVSGARHFAAKRADGRQQQGIDLFMEIANTCAMYAESWAIENPIGIMSRLYRKPDQIIQPWMFGHPETKATCLWLHNLRLLMPTNNVKEQMLALPVHQRNRIHYAPPSKDRWKIRSKTYQGVADAMAAQWGTHE